MKFAMIMALVGFAFAAIVLLMPDISAIENKEDIFKDKPVTPIKISENVYKLEIINGQIIEDYNQGKAIAKLTSTKRLVDYFDENNKPVYIDYKVREDATNIYFESAHLSAVINKEHGTYEEFPPGKINGGSGKKVLTHTIKEALNGTDIWNPVMESVQNNVYYTKNTKGIQVIVEKNNYSQNNSTGDSGGNWKTIYDIYNNGLMEWTYDYVNLDDNKNDHKYGFTFVCDGIDCDDVKVDGEQVQTGESKDKSEILGRGLKVGQSNFDLKNEQHDYTWSLSKPQNNKLVVDFTNAKGPLPIGDTLTVDPTFTSSTSSVHGARDSSFNGNCSDSKTSYTATTQIVIQRYTGTYDCDMGAIQWDTSSIDDDVTITDVKFQFEIDSVGGTANCDITPMTVDITTATDAQIFDDIQDGTEYVDNDTSECNSSGSNKELDLGTSADSDLESGLVNDRFTIGIKLNNMLTTGNVRIDTSTGTPNPTLVVTYEVGTQLTNKPTSITTESLPFALNGTWSSCTGYNGCSDVEGLSIWNVTDIHYADKPLPTEAGTDTEYSSVTNSVTMANTDIHFNFDGFLNQTSGLYTTTSIQNITDVSGNNNNATNVNLDNITLVTGLIESAIDDSAFPLNFTTTDNLYEGTNDFHLGTFVNATAWPFTITAFLDSGNEITLIGMNETKIYVRIDNSTDVASVDNSMNLNSWSFVGVDRNSNTFTFTLNGTTIGTNSSSTDLATADSNEFFIGGNGTGFDKSSGELDEFFIKRTTDSQDSAISERGFNEPTWLENITTNQTFAHVDDLNINEESFYVVTLSNAVGNSTTWSDLLYGTTDTNATAPTLVASAASATQIDFISTAGASDGGDTVKDYGLRCELNASGGWLDTVSNSTLPANRSYNYTGLSTGDVLVCQWRDGNGVGWSEWSNNATATTFEGIVYSFANAAWERIGDAILFNFTGTLDNGVPDPTLTSFAVLQNGTTLETFVIGQTIAKGNVTVFGDYSVGELTANNIYNFTGIATITNSTGPFTFTNEILATVVYTGNYIAAQEGTEFINYTVSREDDDATLRIVINRQNIDLDSPTQDYECRLVDELYEEGDWINRTDIYAYNVTESVGRTITVYGSCYNDELLFVFSSGGTGNATTALVDFLESAGTFLGVPVSFLFILFMAAAFTGRSAPTGIIFLAITIGLMGYMGYFPDGDGNPLLDTATWSLIVFLAAIGIFMGKRFF